MDSMIVKANTTMRAEIERLEKTLSRERAEKERYQEETMRLKSDLNGYSRLILAVRNFLGSVSENDGVRLSDIKQLRKVVAR